MSKIIYEGNVLKSLWPYYFWEGDTNIKIDPKTGAHLYDREYGCGARLIHELQVKNRDMFTLRVLRFNPPRKTSNPEWRHDPKEVFEYFGRKHFENSWGCVGPISDKDKGVLKSLIESFAWGGDYQGIGGFWEDFDGVLFRHPVFKKWV